METVVGGRPRASVPGRLVRPGPARLDARARRRRQRASTGSTRGATTAATRDARRSASSRRVLRRGRQPARHGPASGSPSDYGWFRQEDVRGWTSSLRARGLLRRGARAVRARAPRAGAPRRRSSRTACATASAGRRASAVLCAELCPRRLRRLLSPDGVREGARGVAPARTYRRVRPPHDLDVRPRDGLRPHGRAARDPDARAGVRRGEIAPHAAAWDREHRFPRELFPKLGELGLMGVCVPEEYGGAGADFLSYVLVLEELSRADAGVGVTVAVHTSAATLPILAFGTDEQRARFVPPLARGETIGAFALTEPGSGSDAGALRTAADAGRRRLACSPARSSGSRTAATPARSSSSRAPTRRPRARAASRLPARRRRTSR